jgi:putative serine protease PepD
MRYGWVIRFVPERVKGWPVIDNETGPATESSPLPVCDYTGDSDAPCEEPAVQRRWSSAAVVVAAALGALVGGVLVAAGVVWALGLVPGVAPLETPVQRVLRSETTVAIPAKSEALTISEAVATKVVPSVVSVSLIEEGVNPWTGQQVVREAGSGSGVMIRPDGHILTNYHVIEDASRIVVTVGVDEKEATVVGTDPSSDLAVLSIEGTGYPAIELGSSTDLKVGEYVMAVGSPFGLEKTVTAGIVSALNRSDVIEQSTDLTAYTNLIQTDAAINPGNSGGALVNARGQLVGINTLIQSTSGSSAGIGFAIPIDFAKDIAGQIIATGKATHPYLGVSTESLDENVASQFGLPVSSGALVRFVQPGSPAETAGIATGDIIVRIGDATVESVEDMFTGIRANRVGDVVEVEVVRGESRRTLSATLGSDADRR